MSLLVVFLFVSTFCFRCWGCRNSCGAKWAGNFYNPFVFRGDSLDLGSVPQPDPLHLGFIRCFRRSGWWFSAFLFLA